MVKSKFSIAYLGRTQRPPIKSTELSVLRNRKQQDYSKKKTRPW